MAALAWRNRILRYETVSPETLQPHLMNWRLHPKRQEEALAGALSQVGWVQTIMLNQRTGNMIDGHLRVKLALRRREPEVPIIIVDLSEIEERMVLATLDPIAGMAGTDNERLKALLAEIETTDASVQSMFDQMAEEAGVEKKSNLLPKDKDHSEQAEEAKKLEISWETALGQLWEIPSLSEPGLAHRVFCGDSTTKDAPGRLFDGERAVMTFADPPYNVDYDYASDMDDQKTEADYRDFCANFMRVARLYSDFLVITSGKKFMHVFGKPDDWMIWEKGFAHSAGSWYRALVTEPILLFGKKPTGRFYPRDYFHVPTYKGPGVFKLHSAPKPVTLIEELIEPMTVRQDITYDPFLGSGTTLVACEQLGRICYGMEIEPSYVAIILERATEMNMKPRLVQHVV